MPATDDALGRVGEQLRALSNATDADDLRALFASMDSAFRAAATGHGIATPSPGLQAALAALASWASLAAQRGLVSAVRQAIDRTTAGKPPGTLSDAYRTLVECSDRAWIEIARRDDFSRALGCVINEFASARLGRPATRGAVYAPIATLDPEPSLVGIEHLLPDPAGVLAELESLRGRLQRASETLAGLGEVSPGVTTRRETWSNDIATLYRMGDSTRTRRGPSVMLVYALVNREHVLDLEQRRSFARHLLDAGLDVWLLAWRPPGAYRADVTLEHYVDDAIGGALNAVRAASGRKRVSVAGICQGGTLALCHAARHPGAVHRLVTLVTPVDFHAEGFLLGHWLRHVDVDLLVDAFGNVPGNWLNTAFLALRPGQLGSRKYVDALDRLGDPSHAASFLRMERWLHDSPDQAGEAFRSYARDLIQANGFVNGTLEIGGRPLSLRAVRCPLLNIAALRDHIVPPRAAQALGGLVGSRHYRQEMVDTGHIGMFASRRSAGVAAQVARFIGARSAAAAMTC